MSVDPPHPGSIETVLGLDPRALLSPKARPRDTAQFLITWTPPAAGELAHFFPQFEDFEWVGRGGMAAVYRARHPALDRFVALKLLPPEAASDPIFAERFRIEARALARLCHPHIVSVHDSGQTPDGHLFMVMEYVAGGDLSEALADGPLTVARALSIASAVASALDSAHTHGVVHRDIKPANILLRDDVTVKVADFGLARHHSDTASALSGLTGEGSAVGTPAYMAPEQRAGHPVDGRSDIYSLGVVLYEMVTGDLPQGAWRPPSHKAHSSPQLDALVQRALQLDPADRIPSAAAFRTQLDRLAALDGPSIRRRRILVGSLASLGTLAAAGWTWRRRPRSTSLLSTAPAPALAPTPSAPPPSWSPTPPGTYRPLDALDLKTAAMTGFWHRPVGEPGDTLAIGYTHEKPFLKLLHLPIHPEARAYDLTAELWLEHRGGDLVILFPAGQARPALVLDLYDYSGLEFIRQADWKTNETSVAGLLPTGQYFPLAMRIRPHAERVAITVDLHGRPFLRWEGAQSDLSLSSHDYSPAMVNHRGPGLSLASQYGAARLRAMEVTVHA